MSSTKHAIAIIAALFLFSCAHPKPDAVDTNASVPRQASVTATLAAAPEVIFRGEAHMPPSMADRGKYYLLAVTKNGAVYETIHKRIGAGYVGYTRCEIDYNRQVMRTMGYSEVSVNEIDHSPSKWFDLVPGSSKSDMFIFVRHNVLGAH